MKKLIPIIGSVLLLLVILQPVAAAPLEWTVLGNHTVRTGETLFCIARAYGVDPWAIATQNGIVNANRIRPGQVLAIPAVYMTLPAGPTCTPQFGTTPPEPPVCTCAHQHRVVSGDTLTHLSITYGVSMWRIAQCNNILNLNYIHVGQVLCIPAP